MGSGGFDEACLPESLVIRTIESVRAEMDPNQANGDREEMSDLAEFLEGLFGAVRGCDDHRELLGSRQGAEHCIRAAPRLQEVTGVLGAHQGAQGPEDVRRKDPEEQIQGDQ